MATSDEYDDVLASAPEFVQTMREADKAIDRAETSAGPLDDVLAELDVCDA